MANEALINRCSNVCLDVLRQRITENGAPMQQWNYNKTPNQNWEFVAIGDGYFWLKNLESGKCLDVYQQRITENGALLQQWDYGSRPNQQWKKNDLSDGWFWLGNRESGKALDVHVFDIAKNGATVQQWDYHNASNQQWRIGGDPATNVFELGAFEFSNMTPDEAALTFERQRFAFSRINQCNNLDPNERTQLSDKYKTVIKHYSTTKPGINGESRLNGDQIWLNFQVLAQNGANTQREIAQTLIHEMMHCIGADHPARQGTPGGGGPYYGSGPLRAELCIGGVQSDVSCVHTDNVYALSIIK